MKTLAASTSPPASLTILEAVEHIVEHFRGREEDADLTRALDALRAALASDRLRASGEVDATPRRGIDPAEWRGLAFDFGEPGFVLDWDFVDADPLPLEPMVRTSRAYPAGAVEDHSAPAGCLLPCDGPAGVSGYHRVVTDVTVSAADVERVWPLAAAHSVVADTAKPPPNGKKHNAVKVALRALFPGGVPPTMQIKSILDAVLKHVRQQQKNPTFTANERTVRRAIKSYLD